MKSCPYEDMFPNNNNVIHEKCNTEWNEKDDELKGIKSDTRSWKGNNTCRKDGTVINRLGVAYTLLPHGFLDGRLTCA